MINISSSFFELVTHSRVTTWRATYMSMIRPLFWWQLLLFMKLIHKQSAPDSSNPVCPAIQLKLRMAPFLKATQDSFSKKLWINKSILFFLLSLSCCSNWWSHENAGPYLTGPSGYPSPDPTGMGYMMDGQQAAAAAMMHARPPGDAGYDYPHPAAAYSQYYSHL